MVGPRRLVPPYLWCRRPACTVLCVPCVLCGRFLSGRLDSIPAGCRRDARTTTSRLPHALRQRKRLETTRRRVTKAALPLPHLCALSPRPDLVNPRMKHSEKAVVGSREHASLMVWEVDAVKPRENSVLRHLGRNNEATESREYATHPRTRLAMNPPLPSQSPPPVVLSSWSYVFHHMLPRPFVERCLPLLEFAPEVNDPPRGEFL